MKMYLKLNSNTEGKLALEVRQADLVKFSAVTMGRPERSMVAFVNQMQKMLHEYNTLIETK